MEKREEILRILSIGMREIIGMMQVDYSLLQEIRLRVGQPLFVHYDGKEYFVDQHGRLTKNQEKGFLISAKEIRETIEYVGNYSLYAFEEELKQGFITVQGGHRVGVAGKVIVEGGKVKTVKYISFLHIRLSHEIKGCGKSVFPLLYDRKNDELYHTLILSPPGCGKTTLLRDFIRAVSDGEKPLLHGFAVGVVDERSEIAACYLGVPQNEVGIRTDVMDCCPKEEGIRMLLRSMSPQVIAVDELGGREEEQAVCYASGCGCKIFATIHAKQMDELRLPPVFERYLVLSKRNGIGTIEAVYDKNKKMLYQNKEEIGCLSRE